jgi:hypothetical protein
VATSDAILFGGIRRNEPIANIEGRIGAKAIRPVRCVKCGPIRPMLFEGGKNILFGKVAKSVKAVLAGAVFEVQKLPATVTLKQFHCITILMSAVSLPTRLAPTNPQCDGWYDARSTQSIQRVGASAYVIIAQPPRCRPWWRPALRAAFQFQLSYPGPSDVLFPN